MEPFLAPRALGPLESNHPGHFFIFNKALKLFGDVKVLARENFYGPIQSFKGQLHKTSEELLTIE
jgi:hypothetical protein